ncbi:hypothetical protein [Niallia sp. 03190]|uniref:hypothetical protein n=1 Tax=Niallia sp. 03190 TaxID=3458061 RepID=UPI004044B537
MGHKEFLAYSKAVSTSELGEILGLSTRRIQQLANDDAFVKLGRGQFDLKKSIKKYIDYEVEKRTPVIDEEKLDPTAESALWTRERRKKTELEVKIIQGDLHRSKDVERIMNDMLAAFRARILALPNKMAPQLIMLPDIQVIKDKLHQEVIEAMKELSNYDPNVFYDYSTDKLFLEEDETESEKEKEVLNDGE